MQLKDCEVGAVLKINQSPENYYRLVSYWDEIPARLNKVIHFRDGDYFKMQDGYILNTDWSTEVEVYRSYQQLSS